MRLLGRFAINKTAHDVERSLSRLVAYARHRIPYYRDHLKIAPTVVCSDNRHQIPITTKADLVAQQKPSRISSSSQFPGQFLIGTSGTTGQVLFIRMSRAEALFRSYTFYRSLRENSKLSWPLAMTELGVGPHAQTASRSSLLKRTGLVRLERIPRLWPIDEQAIRLIKSSPQVITGQATCLEAVARHLLQAGRRVQPKLVVSRGEVLAPHVRTLLEQAFDARVVDYYNCEEVGNVAYECPANPERMHVNTDCCIMEIVDSVGKPLPLGAEGRIVVTNLFNFTMPFIRYDLGDYGTMTSAGGDMCSCGSRWPTMFMPSGRSDDFFRLADGTRLAPRTVEAYIVPPMLRLLLRRTPTLIGSPPYQIIQETERSIRVLIAGRLGAQEELRRQIEVDFRAAGHDVSIVIEEVASIPVVEAGKSNRIISRLNQTEEPEVAC